MTNHLNLVLIKYLFAFILIFCKIKANSQSWLLNDFKLNEKGLYETTSEYVYNFTTESMDSLLDLKFDESKNMIFYNIEFLIQCTNCSNECFY
jgi:hypothetical protein